MAKPFPRISSSAFYHFTTRRICNPGRSGRAARLLQPRASQPVATKPAEPGLRVELQGWFARLRWPWLPAASTRSLRDGLEARPAARVTRKSWAEKSPVASLCLPGRFRRSPWGSQQRRAGGMAPGGPIPRDEQNVRHPANASSQPHASAPSAEVTGGAAPYSFQRLSLSPPSFKYI